MANPTYDVHASQASVAQSDIGRAYPGRWTITFSNPPINMVSRAGSGQES